MSGDSDKEQKTEDATPKQRERFREKGEVVKSQDVASAVSIVGGTIGLVVFMSSITAAIGNLSMATLGRLDTHGNEGPLIIFTGRTVLMIVGPFMLLMFILTFLTQVAQVGLKWSPKAMEVNFNKFNPLPAIPRLFFSGNTVVELLKSLVKVVAIGFLSVRVLFDELANSGRFSALNSSEIMLRIAQISLKVVIHAGIAISIIAVIDYLIARYRLEQKMKMTKQEVKDEFKQQDGDPMLKGRMRGRQRDMARQRMLDAVGEADVVVVNPTHYSAALRYKIGVDSAPVIVALGVDEIAAKIRAKARENGVPIVPNPRLARALYAQGKVGGYIPAELYKAVAALLAWVFNLKGNKG